MNRFKVFWENLTKEQRVGILVLSQLILIVLIVFTAQRLLVEKPHVELEDNTVVDVDLPDNAKEFVSDNIWQIIKMNVPGVDENNISDVIIREGTYEEEVAEDGSVIATFLVDIDSLKQTYVVNTGWSADKKIVYETIVDCPPLSEMKYPETVCIGAYHNTYSLDLYVPYAIYPDGAFDEQTEEAEEMAPNYMITGDEDSHTLNIMVSVCDADKFKQEALNYLKTTPIKLDEYTINYEINDVNVGC